MNRSIDDSDLSQLKQEIAALRRKIEEVESQQTRSRMAGRTPSRWRFSRNRALPVLLVAVGILTTYGVLGAQSNPLDAFFVSKAGDIGIGTRTPGFPLTCPNKMGDKISLFEQSGDHYGFGIQPGLLQIHSSDKASGIAFGYGTSAAFTETMRIRGNGDVGIGKTDPGAKLDVKGTTRLSNGTGDSWFPYTDGNSYVSGKNVIFRSGDTEKMRLASDGNIGIGKTDPKVPLDVKGEIRGRPWISGEYAWQKDAPATRMTKADHSVCFITLISGKFFGEGEVVEITEAGGYWMLGGKAGADHVRAKARCIGAPDNSW
jgi:hypothetical protein